MSLNLQQPKETNAEPIWREVQHPILPLAAQRPQRQAQLHIQADQVAESPSRLTGSQRDHAQAGLDWSRLEASLTGTLVHECLERMAQSEALPGPAELVHWQTPIRAGLSRRGLPKARVNSVTQRVLQLSLQCLDGWGPWLLAKRPWAKNEYAMTAWRNGAWQNAIIDRCFEDDQGHVWLIDYKSNQAPAQDLDAWLQAQCEHYDAQLSTYVDLMRMLLPDKPVTALLYFVDCDRLMAQTKPQAWQAISDSSQL